jgi:hypothetical protein
MRQSLPRLVSQQKAVLEEHAEHIERLGLQAASIQESFNKAEVLSKKLAMQQSQLTSKLEGFYGKLIEIFGLFIAIFSFIIAGIQIASKTEGSPAEMLGKSLALFVPLTLCIVVLLCVIRWTSRREQ